MASFTLAVELGARWLELDVDILADGTPIIIHDTTLDRTTNHSGEFYPLSLSDLDHIDAGSWYGPQFAGQRLPLLSEVIDFVNECGVGINVEIKQNEQGARRTLLLIDAVVEELSRLRDDVPVIISSFSQPLLMKFHERAPGYAIAVLYETAALYEDWRSVLELCGASYIHPEDVALTERRVRAFRDAGYGVNVWTVNDPDRVNQLFNWGCTGIFTDIVDQIPAR